MDEIGGVTFPVVVKLARDGVRGNGSTWSVDEILL
jgi:hypothetical protein